MLWHAQPHTPLQATEKLQRAQAELDSVRREQLVATTSLQVCVCAPPPLPRLFVIVCACAQPALLAAGGVPVWLPPVACQLVLPHCSSPAAPACVACPAQLERQAKAEAEAQLRTAQEARNSAQAQLAAESAVWQEKRRAAEATIARLEVRVV
jgi:hypothetical protein